MKSILDRSIPDIARLVSQGEVSAVEVTRLSLERIERRTASWAPSSRCRPSAPSTRRARSTRGGPGASAWARSRACPSASRTRCARGTRRRRRGPGSSPGPSTWGLRPHTPDPAGGLRPRWCGPRGPAATPRGRRGSGPQRGNAPVREPADAAVRGRAAGAARRAGGGARAGARVVPALRRDRGRAPARGGRGAAGQVQHGRARDGLVDREQRLLPGEEPVGPVAHAGRLLRRQRGRGRRADDGRGAGLGHGRIHPPAGGAHGRGGDQADVRAGLALRPRGVRVEPRSGRALRGGRAGRGAPARGHRRPRSARRHQRRRCPSATTRRRAGATWRGCASACPRSTSPRASTPAVDVTRARGHPRAGGPRLRDRARRAAAHALRGGDLLHPRHGRGVVQPGALRRRALRPPRRARDGDLWSGLYRATPRAPASAAR